MLTGGRATVFVKHKRKTMLYIFYYHKHPSFCRRTDVAYGPRYGKPVNGHKNAHCVFEFLF